MSYYKVGTHINLKKQARKQQIKDDLLNSLFWAALIVGFLYCLYA